MGNIIKSILNVITNSLEVLRTNFPVALSLAALYVIFGVSDQGQDMLINVNNFYYTPLFLYIALVALALMHWQFPKLFTDTALKMEKFSDIFTSEFSSTTNETDYRRLLPRLFGIATFIIPAYCILKLRNLYHVYEVRQGWYYKYIEQYFPMVFFFGSLLIFWMLLRHNVFLRIYKALKKTKAGRRFFRVICISLAFLPVVFMFVNSGLPSNQIFFFWGWLGYAILFGLLTSTRWSLVSDSKNGFIKYIFRGDVITVIIWFLALAATLFFLFFVLANYMGWVYQYTYRITFVIILCAFIFYLTALMIVLYVGRRQKRNYLVFIGIIFYILTIINPGYFHAIEVLKTKNKELVPLRTYIEGWIADRIKGHENDPGYHYPVFLVNSYGGGSRAAAWTCVLVNSLDTLTKGKFQQHVFSYSGASGGTIGASILCANGFNDGFNARSFREKDILYKTFFTQHDLLTSDVVGLLGNDAFSSLVPYNRFADRAVFQARSWEKAYQRVFDATIYKEDFFALWNNERYRYRVPLLFSNSSEVTLGYVGTVAPVSLDARDFTGHVLVQDLLGPDSSLKFSTASFLSARFPYISPAGYLRNRYFIDGGAKENSGAETSKNVYDLFIHVLDSLSRAKGVNYRDKFPIYCISIKSTNQDEEKIESVKKVSQLLAPVLSVVNGGINGASERADAINRAEFGNRYFLLYPKKPTMRWTDDDIFHVKHTDTTKVVLPLGWQLSDLVMGYFENSVNDYTDTIHRHNILIVDSVLKKL